MYECVLQECVLGKKGYELFDTAARLIEFKIRYDSKGQLHWFSTQALLNVLLFISVHTQPINRFSFEKPTISGSFSGSAYAK